ncbi:MAG: IS110 family transposase [Chryseobacterium sp.]|nr:MAG: IS110 family transposase [Chryseobacterium sp.]
MQKRIVKGLDTEIEKLEAEIMRLIKSNQELNNTLSLLLSMKGIGLVVACQMICTTKNFKRFANARKFNCYAGLAPFKNESGTSIRGKARVSHLANKEIKTLLNMAAFCALRYDPELKAYYERRVSEGSSKMKCVNIIRAKLVARMFAIIKRQTPYQVLQSAA